MVELRILFSQQLLLLCISFTTLILAQNPTTTTTSSLVPVIPTMAPTTTWSPTMTPAPTYVACNICGDDEDDAVITAETDIIVLPPEIGQNITCQEANEASQLGFISPNNCGFLQDAILAQNVCACTIPNNNNNNGGTTSTTNPPVMAPAICELCGNGYYASNRSGIIPYQNDDFVQCGFVEEAGKSTVWNAEACAYFQQQAESACDCQPGSFTPSSSSCDICGSSGDLVVGAPDAQLNFGAYEGQILLGINVPPDVDPLSCQFLETHGKLNVWSPLVCAFLQQEASKSCECRSSGETGTNISTTVSTSQQSTKYPENNHNNIQDEEAMTPSQSPASSVHPLSSSSASLYRNSIVSCLISSRFHGALVVLVSTMNFFL